METSLGLAIELNDATSTLTLRAPLGIRLESAGAIQLQAPVITLTTNGLIPTSAVLIEGNPYGMHVHGLPPPIPGPLPTPPVLP
jgi:hypothetical protein